MQSMIHSDYVMYQDNAVSMIHSDYVMYQDNAVNDTQ